MPIERSELELAPVLFADEMTALLGAAHPSDRALGCSCTIDSRRP